MSEDRHKDPGLLEIKFRRLLDLADNKDGSICEEHSESDMAAVGFVSKYILSPWECRGLIVGTESAPLENSVFSNHFECFRTLPVLCSLPEVIGRTKFFRDQDPVKLRDDVMEKINNERGFSNTFISRFTLKIAREGETVSNVDTMKQILLSWLMKPFSDLLDEDKLGLDSTLRKISLNFIDQISKNRCTILHPWIKLWEAVNLHDNGITIQSDLLKSVLRNSRCWSSKAVTPTRDAVFCLESLFKKLKEIYKDVIDAFREEEDRIWTPFARAFSSIVQMNVQINNIIASHETLLSSFINKNSNMLLKFPLFASKFMGDKERNKSNLQWNKIATETFKNSVQNMLERYSYTASFVHSKYFEEVFGYIVYEICGSVCLGLDNLHNVIREFYSPNSDLISWFDKYSRQIIQEFEMFGDEMQSISLPKMDDFSCRLHNVIYDVSSSNMTTLDIHNHLSCLPCDIADVSVRISQDHAQSITNLKVSLDRILDNCRLGMLQEAVLTTIYNELIYEESNAISELLKDICTQDKHQQIVQRCESVILSLNDNIDVGFSILTEIIAKELQISPASDTPATDLSIAPTDPATTLSDHAPPASTRPSLIHLDNNHLPSSPQSSNPEVLKDLESVYNDPEVDQPISDITPRGDLLVDIPSSDYESDDVGVGVDEGVDDGLSSTKSAKELSASVLTQTEPPGEVEAAREVDQSTKSSEKITAVPIILELLTDSVSAAEPQIPEARPLVPITADPISTQQENLSIQDPPISQQHADSVEAVDPAYTSSNHLSVEMESYACPPDLKNSGNTIIINVDTSNKYHASSERSAHRWEVPDLDDVIESMSKLGPLKIGARPNGIAKPPVALGVTGDDLVRPVLPSTLALGTPAVTCPRCVKYDELNVKADIMLKRIMVLVERNIALEAIIRARGITIDDQMGS